MGGHVGVRAGERDTLTLLGTRPGVRMNDMLAINLVQSTTVIHMHKMVPRSWPVMSSVPAASAASLRAAPAHAVGC